MLIQYSFKIIKVIILIYFIIVWNCKIVLIFVNICYTDYIKMFNYNYNVIKEIIFIKIH